MATIKQKKAFKEITENNRPVSPVMREVGYSKETATKPSNLTKSKGWNELMEKHLPDSVLAAKHREGLEASKEVYKNNNDTGEVEHVGTEADYNVRHKYLDSAYKLKGRYIKEEDPTKPTSVHFTQIIINPPHGTKSPRNQPHGETVPSVASPSES